MKPIVQISLDITNIPEALETAAMALRAGVDWLEAGHAADYCGGDEWCARAAAGISESADCR